MNLAIIQARMASTRLPGKALLEIGEQTLIYYVLARAKRIKGIDKVLLATSSNKENDVLTDYVQNMGFEVFRGDENDVIERFYLVADKYNAKNIIRLTGDNPMIDFSAMSFLLSHHLEDGNDYTCMNGFPCGALGDIFSFHALKESHLHADGKALSDHVDLYVLENMDRFTVSRYITDQDFSTYRWTVDDETDLRRMRQFFEILSRKNIRLEEINTRDAVYFINNEDLESAMQPKEVNISKQNLYTAELAGKISKKVSICFEGIN